MSITDYPGHSGGKCSFENSFKKHLKHGLKRD